LTGCRIKQLPEDLFNHLPRIRWLDMRCNLMLSLPNSLSHNPTLEVLLLDQNLFTSIPPVLQTLPRLHTLGLRGNILSSPPLHIIDQGVRAIQSWLAQVPFSGIKGVLTQILRNAIQGYRFIMPFSIAQQLIEIDKQM
jgi:Leucine-rich repeat (LRR) protein